MHDDILTPEALELASLIKNGITGFYLAGGTGLALQLGHRKSEDLDFFSTIPFHPQTISDYIKAEKISEIRENALHCIKNGVKLTFLFYDVHLTMPTILWNGLEVASWEDIVAEKVKTISQRGAKKDFYDVYGTIILKASIKDVCSFFWVS
jgi:hypothetical protein